MSAFSSKTVLKENIKNKLQEMFHVELRDAGLFQKYSVLANLLNEDLNTNYERTRKYINDHNLKKTIYFSMEFLMGRLSTNNIINSGHYDVIKETLDELGWDLNEIEQREADTGLGNGGLGRLAACFLDSAASLSLPVFGNSLRYQHGFFIQDIINHKQVEKKDTWLDEPFYWETRKDSETIEIPFFGYVEHTRLINPIYVKAVPYDVKIVGNKNGVVNHLRLWKTEPSSLHQHHDHKYLEMVRSICDQLYPDDSSFQGKTLRLQQQYLFSAAGVKSAVNEHIYLGRNIKDFDKYYVFQINDTHPALVIPELMRILMDDYHLGYDEAWKITSNTVAFTNHTILSEALEKWDINIFRNLLPRIFEIILEMDRRFKRKLKELNYNDEKIFLMGLVGKQTVRMANLCNVGSFSVNGVAKLHTQILKTTVMKNFYELYPQKFNNKTNGITHRRWLIHSNKELTNILNEYIGTSWQNNLEDISKLKAFSKDKVLQQKIKVMKLNKKKALAKVIYQEQGIDLDVHSIFDIQVKRLHEYKRQLLNILHVIYLYQRLKTDAQFKKNFHPQSFIFGAKAAPSYNMAKAIIELINMSSTIINRDKETNDLLKVVFVKNYNVTYAEKIMPACDLSEQISTASKEASGTGNMKFMLNGALTIGTLDGANVEIVEHAGRENEFIFGLNAEEVNELYSSYNYLPNAIYEKDKRLQNVFEFIRSLTPNPHHFDFILSNLLNSDYYLVLKDFDAYVKAQEKANKMYKNEDVWLEKSIINIASAGFFSSDRTISEYNKDIWKLEKITF